MKILTTNFALLLAVLLFSGTQQSKAQEKSYVQKGSNEVGLTLHGGVGGHYDYSGGLGLNYGYFAANKFAVGAKLNYFAKGDVFKAIEPGIYGKWYVLNSNFTPTLEFGFNYAFEQTKDESQRTINGQYFSPHVKVGVAYMGLLKKRLSVELNYNHSFHSNTSFTGIGIHYRF